MAQLTARAVPLVPKPRLARDVAFTVFCGAIAVGILTILGMAIWGSLIKYWPYNLSLTWANYDFEKFDSDGWSTYFNSLRMAVGVAICGTALTFVGAWLTERTRGFGAVRGLVQFLAVLPVAVPGLVLGLGYIFFFNAPWNPLNFSLWYDVDPGDQHRWPLVHGRPSHLDDRAEADRSPSSSRSRHR